jgi:Tol biopolymer transport system component
MEILDLALGDEVYVGLFVCAHNPDVVETGVFSDVRISVPAKEDFVPYTDYIGGNLEILEVASGKRTIIHHSDRSLQAPNWTPDGKALIYNEDGLMYRFDLETGAATQIDTAFATTNNNDHVLSFDGRMLGISHHSKDHGGASIVYVLPVEGGTPRLVTPKGPSYLHGWTTDGRELIYTGGRDGNYDIYKIPVEGGEEVRLTTAKGLDDGSEFTPDGKYIYFHSSRGGTMQIWRMKPDGSDQEQVTDDGFNNWFPHISPDGKWIVFLTYLPDVDPGDHPWYKQVYIRLMPIEGGASKVLAYVYGGQGTINVPSWSPDCSKVAFASYTD